VSQAALAYYARLGIGLRAVLTDNGPRYRSRAFAVTCRHLGIKHRFTRPYTRRTNDKAERFIQTALREWAYARTRTPPSGTPPLAAPVQLASPACSARHRPSADLFSIRTTC
jgi:transposase InsO family protein